MTTIVDGTAGVTFPAGGVGNPAGAVVGTTDTQTLTNKTLTSPVVGTTLGVGGATPSASGSGITFPATQSASSDANTLDDYEEGTWTPAITFGGGSTGVIYDASNLGYYTKVGRLVTLTFVLNVTNKGSSTGSALINGAPFNCINAQAGRGGLAIGYTSGLNVNNPNVMLTAGTSQMGYRTPNAGDLSDSNFSASFTTYGSYSYFI